MQGSRSSANELRHIRDVKKAKSKALQYATINKNPGKINLSI